MVAKFDSQHSPKKTTLPKNPPFLSKNYHPAVNRCHFTFRKRRTQPEKKTFQNSHQFESQRKLKEKKTVSNNVHEVAGRVVEF